MTDASNIEAAAQAARESARDAEERLLEVLGHAAAPLFSPAARARLLGFAWVFITLAVAILVAAAVHWITKPAPAVVEHTAPAPQVRQADGSVVAERAPATSAAPLPPAPHMLPRGAHEERRERVVVAPRPAASSVEVDLSLVRQGNERRVIASSPDGEVVSALDIPIDPSPLPPAPRPWAAGLSYGTDRAVGVWLERDVGRLRVGAEVERAPAGRAEARLRVGVTW